MTETNEQQNQPLPELIVHTRVTEKDYAEVMFFLLYRSWGYWFLAITGFLLVTAYPLLLWKGGGWQWMIILYGFLLILWAPLRTALDSRKNFRSNARIQEPMTYAFTNDQMHVKGESFDASCNWRLAHKVGETDLCFLIYQSKTTTNILPRRDFTPDQIQLFRKMVEQSGLKYRWR